MRYSLCLLTAGWLAGGAAAAPQEKDAPRITPIAQTLQSPPQETPPPPPGKLGDRIRSLFSPRPAEARNAVQPAAATSAPQTPAAPRPVVVSQDATATAATPSPAPRLISSATQGNGLSAKDLEKVGHENDYSWITGKLSRVGGGWQIRYAGPYEVDRFGGILTLAPHAELASYHEGDLVCVHGRVNESGRALRSASGPVYQLQTITLIERAGR
jgi:hypothetical protein